MGKRGTFRPGPIRIPGLTGCRPLDCTSFGYLLKAVVTGAEKVAYPSSKIDVIVEEEDAELNLACRSDVPKQCVHTRKVVLPPELVAAPLTEMVAPHHQHNCLPALWCWSVCTVLIG